MLMYGGNQADDSSDESAEPTAFEKLETAADPTTELSASVRKQNETFSIRYPRRFPSMQNSL